MGRSPDASRPGRRSPTQAGAAGSGALPDEDGRPPRAPDDELELVGLLLETASGLRRRLSPSIEAELGVGGQAFEVLVRLARTPGQRLRMSDLAAQTGLSPGGLTRSVDRLVGEGLAGRESCPSDRRGSYARLTPLGAKRMEEALARHATDVSRLLSGLFSEDETATLAALVRRLRDRVHPDAALVTGAGQGVEVKGDGEDH